MISRLIFIQLLLIDESLHSNPCWLTGLLRFDWCVTEYRNNLCLQNNEIWMNWWINSLRSIAGGGGLIDNIGWRWWWWFYILLCPDCSRVVNFPKIVPSKNFPQSKNEMKEPLWIEFGRHSVVYFPSSSLDHTVGHEIIFCCINSSWTR